MHIICIYIAYSRDTYSVAFYQSKVYKNHLKIDYLEICR